MPESRLLSFGWYFAEKIQLSSISKLGQSSLRWLWSRYFKHQKTKEVQPTTTTTSTDELGGEEMSRRSAHPAGRMLAFLWVIAIVGHPLGCLFYKIFSIHPHLGVRRHLPRCQFDALRVVTAGTSPVARRLSTRSSESRKKPSFHRIHLRSRYDVPLYIRRI